MQISNWRELYQHRYKNINSFYRHNKPYFIIGANFGPYDNEDFETIYRELFTKCKDVCFRDLKSFNLFSGLNNVRHAPDIVFQLKPKNVTKRKDSIGISLIDLKERVNMKGLERYKEVYINKIKEIINIAQKNNKNITFFSFCKDQGDEDIINEILRQLDQDTTKSIEVVNYNGNIDEFLEKFESMENIIGTRFHACILSQVFGQGLYPIIYSKKTYNVLKDIELAQEYCYIKNIEKLDVNNLFNVIDNNKINDTSIFKEAEKQFEGLDKYVSER